MEHRTIRIRGELYLTLEAAAECYQVEVEWVRRVYELDLLGPGQPLEQSTAIAARMLDRLAEIRRLHLHTGMDLEAIALVLLREPSD